MSVALTDGITLLSGALFDYNAPEACPVTIGDIAGALGNVCRFAGHLPRFYSVAQHAVNVSRIVPPEHALAGLLHDTAEAFTNDLPTPLKHAVPVFKALEERIEAAMADRFGFDYPLSAEVKLADLQMLAIEKRYIKRDLSCWEVLDGIAYEHLVGEVDLRHLTPLQARFEFLKRFAELAA